MSDEMTWRSIDSAPKDGTEFLALLSNGWHALVCAPAEAIREGWPYCWWRSTDRRDYPVVETHPADTDWAAMHTLLLTHWMPLPPPPSEVTP